MTVTSGVTVCLVVTVASGKLGMAESSPKIKHFLISSTPGMASLLNNLDKLPVLADNNSNEPDPTNVVVEDKDADGTLVDILTVDKVSRDKSTLTIQRIVGGVA